MKQYPEYTKEDILDATKTYVEALSHKGYKGISCADYFINKNGISVLAAQLEDISERENIRDTFSQGMGSFHREN